MRFLREVTKELLKTRGIKQPYKYLGEIEYNDLYNKTKNGKHKTSRTMKKLAKKLDVPVNFIKRIVEYEEMEEWKT